MDLYVFATPYRVTWDYYFLSREHTLEFKEWEGKAEFEYVSCEFLRETFYCLEFSGWFRFEEFVTLSFFFLFYLSGKK